MKAVSGRDFARLVERRGWQLLRINGSHHIYGSAGSVVRLSIRSMGIARSRSVCCVTSRNSPKSPMTNCYEAGGRGAAEPRP
jgi:hypothetical protein